MGKAITLFSGYGQKENRTTNYCLLILKLIYEENPKYFSEVVSQLVGENIGARVGVNFLQQTRKGKSVPDGIFSQKSFMVYIETKLHNGFGEQQLLNHIDALHHENSEQKVLLALGNFESEEQKKFKSIHEEIKLKYGDKLFFVAKSFEEFVDALEIKGLSKNTIDAILDFSAYLDEQDLLPTWKTRLDVINCVGLPDDVLIGNVYMCPAEGGAYSHKRSKFFGMYRNRCVEKVSLIEAVVDVIDLTTAELKWSNLDGDAQDFKQKAIDKVMKYRNEYPTRVFLLGDLYDTDFKKDTPGGLQGSKLYFDLSKLLISEAKELSVVLSGKYWSELR